MTTDTYTYNPTRPNALSFPGLTELGEKKKESNEESEKYIFYTQSIDLDLDTSIMTVPLSLSIFNFILGILCIGFFTQFIMAIRGIAFINGFTALMGSIVTFGLFKVFYKVSQIVKRKNV